MTVQDVADILGPLGFIPEWRFGRDNQQWVHPKTGVRLSVRKLDGVIQFRKMGKGPVFSEWQSDECNYSADIHRVLKE